MRHWPDPAVKTFSYLADDAVCLGRPLRPCTPHGSTNHSPDWIATAWSTGSSKPVFLFLNRKDVRGMADSVRCLTLALSAAHLSTFANRECNSVGDLAKHEAQSYHLDVS